MLGSNVGPLGMHGVADSLMRMFHGTYRSPDQYAICISYSAPSFVPQAPSASPRILFRSIRECGCVRMGNHYGLGETQDVTADTACLKKRALFSQTMVISP